MQTSAHASRISSSPAGASPCVRIAGMARSHNPRRVDDASPIHRGRNRLVDEKSVIHPTGAHASPIAFSPVGAPPCARIAGVARSHNSVGWITPYPSTGAKIAWWMKKASSTLRRPCLANRLLTCGSVAMRAIRGHGPLPQFRGVDDASPIHRGRNRLVDEKSVIRPMACEPMSRKSPTHLWERRHARESRAWPAPTV